MSQQWKEMRECRKDVITRSFKRNVLTNPNTVFDLNKLFVENKLEIKDNGFVQTDWDISQN